MGEKHGHCAGCNKELPTTLGSLRRLDAAHLILCGRCAADDGAGEANLLSANAKLQAEVAGWRKLVARMAKHTPHYPGCPEGIEGPCDCGSHEWQADALYELANGESTPPPTPTEA